MRLIYSSEKVTYDEFVEYAFTGSLNEQMMTGCVIQRKEEYVKENQELLKEKYERYYNGKGKGKGLDTKYWGIRLDWSTPADKTEPEETKEVEDEDKEEELKDYVRVQQALGGHSYN
tara:strand:- start:212 stop:562 length:351 start_codon:yes stop_codon:yes gene_type:complete